MADGVTLAVTPAGTIRAIGNKSAVERWLPLLREHKRELAAALAAEDRVRGREPLLTAADPPEPSARLA
jgi:hypothetical protein